MNRVTVPNPPVKETRKMFAIFFPASPLHAPYLGRYSDYRFWYS